MSFKTFISASTPESLLSQVEGKLNQVSEKDNDPIAVKSPPKTSPQILGIFTGQGAQWATMGRDLYLTSATFRRAIESLDDSLSQLPSKDRPSWTIAEELLKDKASSRMSEAALSQPLCTAVQIALVDMLKSAYVKFKAVVGHSSGEIAASYAAELISASDAIRIAYYRGLYAYLACGADGKKGAMLATGTSFDDAQDLCELPDFKGRIIVAASNSSASITLSGDADAIDEVELIFQEEKKFARLLKVDTAYHSHHMQPCAGPYTEALVACNIEVKQPSATASLWFSSVKDGQLMAASDDIAANYWCRNMTQPVMFSAAMEAALRHEGNSYDLALEVGPHPALKSPATQVIQDSLGADIPYSGVLSRSANDLDTFSKALGFIWTYLGPSAVDFAEYDRAFFPDQLKPSFSKDLPFYSWDHERSFWYDSRLGLAHRHRQGPPHSLIGVQYGDKTDTEVKWRNYLIPNEISWISHHQIQGQPIFPAAAYAAMAWEGALNLTQGKQVRLIEIEDVIVGQPITFDDNSIGVETILTLSDIINEKHADGSLKARWSVHASLAKNSSKLALISSGKINLNLAEPCEDVLPPKGEVRTDLVDIEVDDFYSALKDLGYGYTGPFRAMRSLERRMNFSSGEFSMPTTDMLMHPALLDISFQALFAALSYPGDGALWSLHVPTAIQRVRVNPYHCVQTTDQELELSFVASLAEAGGNKTLGDVTIYAPDGHQAMLQVEGVSSVPLFGATAADDRCIFSEVIWDEAVPNGDAVFAEANSSVEEVDIGYACERVAHFYLRRLLESIKDDPTFRVESHHQILLKFASHVAKETAAAKHRFSKPEWVNDTQIQILEVIKRYAIALSQGRPSTD